MGEPLDEVGSDDAKCAARALGALRRSAILEGEVTPAAAALAPRLVELAGADRCVVLPAVLRLLADLLVCGDADRWIKVGYDVRTPAFEAADPDQYGRALYESIAAGAPRYLALLGHSDVAVRAHVAPLLAYLSRETEQVRPALRARLEHETAPAAQASLAIALAHQARYAADADAIERVRAMSRAADPVVATGASAALAVLEGAATPAHAIETLLVATKKQRKKLKEVPWMGGDLASLAVVVGASIVERKRDAVLAARWVAAAEKLPTRFWALGAMLEAAFAADTRPTPRAPGELDAHQMLAVKTIAASDDVERLAERLTRAGLCPDARALGCLAGDGPPTALARVVDGEPLLRTAARALRTAEDEDAWHRILATLSDDDRIAVARDAHCHPLRIWSLPRPSALDPDRDAFLVDDRDDRALLSRAVEVLARDLTACPASKLAEALERLAKEKLQPPGYLAALVFAACESAAREGAPPPDAVDAPFAKINPGSTFGAIALLRRALERLALPRREAVVLARHYWHAAAPDGAASVVGGAWLIADLAPTAAVARAIVQEITSWNGGSPPYPEAHAIATLSGLGEAALPAIEAALERAPALAAVLTRAREAIRAHGS